MRILFICDAFPPDTTIGGIRPFMFAKYLQQFGHEVTVLRSGKIYSMKSTTEYDSWLGKMRIISAFNGNTVAGVQPFSKKKRKTPEYVKEIYFALREPLNILKNHKHFDTLYKKQKAAIDDLRRERYDIVFSTFSPASDIYSGEYAAKKFGCKWILDFRDAMIQPDNRTWLWNRFFRSTQVKAVEKCDLCTTVSDGVRRMVSAGTKSANIVTLYNGYDEVELPIKTSETKQLTLCYTGGIYAQRMAAMSKILQAISLLSQAGKIDLMNIRLCYAGSKADALYSEMCKYGIEKTLDNHGYLSSHECNTLQMNSDLFLVLSWNTKGEQGILTGKFYEGIRAKKPMIVSVVGDEPNSELAELNREYHYGICFEKASQNSMMGKLCEFIKEKYDEKMTSGKLKYEQDPRLTEKFKYEHLSRELESLCQNLLDK